MNRMLLAALLLLTASNLSAQDPQIVIDDSPRPKPRPQVGLLAGLTMGYSTTDYHASQIDRSLGFGPTILAQGQFPIGGTSKLLAQAGYHTLAFSDKHNNRIAVVRGEGENSTRVLPAPLTTDGQFNYFLIGGGFKLSAFFICLNVGFPVSATVENTMENTQPDAEGNYPLDEGYVIPADISPEKEDINTLIELRAGGEFTVLQDAMGDLNLGFSLAWTFGNIISSSGDDLPIMEDQFHIPSVTVHASWLFNL